MTSRHSLHLVLFALQDPYMLGYMYQLLIRRTPVQTLRLCWPGGGRPHRLIIVPGQNLAE